MVGFFAYDLVRRLERLPELAVDDLKLPDMLLLLATDIAAVDHHEGTITLIANAVNWNGTDERVDEAYDDAVARLDVMTAALGQPLPSTVATFSQARAACTARSARVEEYGAIVETSRRRDRGAARHSRWCRRSGSRWTPTSTRSTCTGCCGCPTPARTCICCNVPNDEGGTDVFDRRLQPRGAGDGAGRLGDDASDRRNPVARRTPRKRTSCWRRSCWPTRRNAPST